MSVSGLRVTTEGAIARITLDRPPLNVLTTAMMVGMAEGFQKQIASPWRIDCRQRFHIPPVTDRPAHEEVLNLGQVLRRVLQLAGFEVGLEVRERLLVDLEVAVDDADLHRGRARARARARDLRPARGAAGREAAGEAG